MKNYLYSTHEKSIQPAYGKTTFEGHVAWHGVNKMKRAEHRAALNPLSADDEHYVKKKKMRVPHG